MTYEALWKRLTPLYEAGEAKAIARWMLDVRFGLTMADILCNIVPVTVLLLQFKTYRLNIYLKRIPNLFRRPRCRFIGGSNRMVAVSSNSSKAWARRGLSA